MSKSNTATLTIRFLAVHIPNEHPSFGFATKEEAMAFINGYSLRCGHEGKNKFCDGALAEWSIEEINN